MNNQEPQDLRLTRFIPGHIPSNTASIGADIAATVKEAAPELEAAIAGLRSRGLPVEALLGLIAYCYAKGLYNSAEIEERLWLDPRFTAALGERLPDAEGIRRFRRQHREAILTVLELAFNRYWHRRRAAGLPDSSAGDTIRQAHAEARRCLDQAIFRDHLESE